MSGNTWAGWDSSKTNLQCTCNKPYWGVTPSCPLHMTYTPGLGRTPSLPPNMDQQKSQHRDVLIQLMDAILKEMPDILVAKDGEIAAAYRKALESLR